MKKKKTTEGSRRSDRRDILCVRDWPGLEKVESQGNNKGDVRFLRRKERKSNKIGEFEKGKFVMVVEVGVGRNIRKETGKEKGRKPHILLWL